MIVPHETVMEYARLPVQLFPPSVAVTVKLEVPVAVGVPEITPPLDNPRPAGNDPTVTAYVYEPNPPLDVMV